LYLLFEKRSKQVLREHAGEPPEEPIHIEERAEEYGNR
jgi:hypothetical protein